MLDMYKFFKENDNVLMDDPNINKIWSSNENIKTLDDMFLSFVNSTSSRETSHNSW